MASTLLLCGSCVQLLRCDHTEFMHSIHFSLFSQAHFGMGVDSTLGAIEGFWDNFGFVLELVQQFNALVIFAEHVSSVC